MAGILTLALLFSMMVFIVGFIGLFIRIPKLKLTSRKRAAWTMAGSFLAFASIGMALPDPAAAPSSKKPAPGASPATPVLVDHKAELQSQSDRLWEQVKAELSPCESHMDFVAKATRQAGEGTGSLADAYEATVKAKQACAATWLSMEALKPPAAAKGEVWSEYDSALEHCKNAALYRQTAMGSLAKFIDGDRRPSAEVEAKEDMQSARDQSAACGVGFLVATQKAGVTLKEIREAQANSDAADKSKRPSSAK